MNRRAFLAAGAAALAAPAAAGPTTAHAFAFRTIEGEPLPLARFAKRPVLVANTASRCGFTPQYAGLQALWSRYGGRGLVVIGAPSGDFGQELGAAAAVKDFCELNYGVSFPLTEIVRVTGPKAHPFFAWAAAQAGPPRWNFHKYLIDGDGRLVAAFPTGVEPLSTEVISSVEGLLAGA